MKTPEIKTFTIHLDSATELGSFSSMLIDEIKDKFQNINELKKNFQSDLNKQIANMENFPILSDVIRHIRQSNAHIDDIFNDFIVNQDYFTIMFFGSVNAGKSSMICDISNTNPVSLNEYLICQPNYQDSNDKFVIDTNVATLNLYELLFDESNLRLVDVPGIGGLKHDNNLIIPFADMADCIIFLIDANGDAKQDELIFLENIFSKIKSNEKDNVEIYDSEKTVIFTLNKWNAAFPKEDYTMEESEKEFRKKRDAILEGSEQRVGFNSLFSEVNQPLMVKTNTSRRKDNGEPRNKAEIEELKIAINQVLKTKGKSIRLNRPKNVLIKEFSKMRTELLQQKNDKVIQNSLEVLRNAGFNIIDIATRMKKDTSANIEVISQTVYVLVEQAIRTAIDQWKPEVRWGEKFSMLVPNWVADSMDWEAGSHYVKQELKERWHKDIENLFNKNLDVDKIKQISQKQFNDIAEKLVYTFQAEIEKADPLLNKKVNDAGKDLDDLDSEVSLTNMMGNVVEKIQNEILNDLLTVVIAESIVLVLTKFMFFITGPGALLILGIRRFWGWVTGSAKKREVAMKEALNREIYNGANEAADGVRIKIEEVINANITKMYQAYAGALDSRLNELLAPLKLVDEAIVIIENKRKELSEIHFEN